MEANKFTSFGMGGYENYNGARNSQMFRSILGAPIVHPGTALPWSLDMDVPENITRPKPAKALENGRRPSVAPSHAGKASISGPSISGPIGPILRNASFDAADGGAEGQVPTSNPFGKVKTVDLKTAAEAERQRIGAAYERDQERKSAATTTTMRSPPVSTSKSDRSASVKRKPLIPQLPSGPAGYRVSAVSGQRGVPHETGFDSPSSSRQSAYAVGVEGSDWGVRNSTRANSISTEDDDTTRYTDTVVSHAPYTLAAPPRIPQLEGVGGDAKVMFVGDIVYDDPALVRSIIGKTDIALTTSRYSHPVGTAVRRSPSSATKRLPGIDSPAKEVDVPLLTSSSTSVMERPRTLKKELERGIFPQNRDSGLAVEMKYRKHLTIERESALPPLVLSKPRISLPAPQIITKKPSMELGFPIPPSRTSSTRKPAPPPITITIPVISSPEIVQVVPSPEQISSARPAIPAKSEKRMTSQTGQQKDTDERKEDAAYEAAKAWIDSVSTENTHSSYAASVIVPLPSTAYQPESSINSPEMSASTRLRMSLISLTLSPKSKQQDEGDFTDIDIDSGSEVEDDESEDEGFDEQTLSEADEMIMSGGEGYSTEESYEDYLTDSEEGQEYAHDGVVISDVEDGTTYDKIALAERRLNAKMHTITVGGLPDAIPRHFQIGDRIPTFSESRRKYGSRRKPPPSPIGFLMRQRRESQQRIQARLLVLAGNQNLAPLDDLMNRLPANNQRSYISDGRSSLLAKLEMEIGQQESKWMGMHHDLKRDSVESSGNSPAQVLARLSQNIAQRRSFLAKLNSGIDRRLSNAQTIASKTTPSSMASSSAQSPWQQNPVEAQMEYLTQAPYFSRKAGEVPFIPTSILESQHTPVSVISEPEVDPSEVGSPLSIHGKTQKRSLYKNDNSSFVIGEKEDEHEEDYEEEYEEKEEEEDYEEDYEEKEEEYSDEEEVIHPLQATVYSPSIHSPNIQEPLIQTHLSTVAPPPSIKSPISLLWNPRTHETAPDTNKLWTHHPLPPKTSSAPPPALNLRPKHRTSTAPLSKPTTNLWTKPRPTPPASAGLWRNPKEYRPKSIIVSSTASRKGRSPKRVTFVEEVVTGKL